MIAPVGEPKDAMLNFKTMPYQASLADIQKDYLTTPPTSVPNGQCVAFVEKAAATPRTAGWTRGAKVAGNAALAPGTAIATFDPAGTYGNHTDGRSHAAIYVSQAPNGIVVYDQWLGQPVHQRTIRFPDPADPPKPVNDATQFYVIEPLPTA